MKKSNLLNLNEIHTENVVLEVKDRLEKKGFTVVVIDDTSKIRNLIEENIPDEILVGLDGSEIINELNVPQYLKDNWNVIIDPYQAGLAPEIKEYLLQKLPGTEFYITSPDAVTIDGKVIFRNKNKFLVHGKSEKPDNIIAFIGSEKILDNSDKIQKFLESGDEIVLEVSPFGLKKKEIDNYGQIEEYHDLMTDKSEKEKTFTIVLLVEEHVY